MLQNKKIIVLFLAIILISTPLAFPPQEAHAVITLVSDNLDATTVIVGEGTSCTVRGDFDPQPDIAILYIYIDDTTEGAFGSISDENTLTWDLRENRVNGNQNVRIYSTTTPTVNADNSIVVNLGSATDFICDVSAYDGVDTGSLYVGGTLATGSSATASVSQTPTTTGNLMFMAYGMTTNGAQNSLGTGQVDNGSGVQGGAEKTAGGDNHELAPDTSSNTQVANLSKSGAWIAVFAEFAILAGASPTYVVDLLDIYESELTTLGTGIVICEDVDLETTPSECTGRMIVGHTYRIEIEVKETAGNSGSPTTIDIDASVADYDVLGNIIGGQIISAGCSTNTNWTPSIVSTDARATSGTTCAISSSSAEWWFIIRINSDAGSGAQPTATFTIDDGSVSDVSTLTTFNIDNNFGGT